MSHYACDTCGVTQEDSPTGFVAGCIHRPPEKRCHVLIEFGDGWVDGVYDGHFAYTFEAIEDGRALHPYRWRIK